MRQRQILIVGIGGTLRAGSTSEQALSAALARTAARGANVIAFTARQLVLPPFEPHLNEEEMPEEARRLLHALRRADGIILSSPCYHGGISGLLKNALDYVEAMSGDERVYLDGLPVGCIGCGFGWQGPASVVSGLRSIVHALRGWPTPLGVTINSAVTKFENDLSADESVMRQLHIMADQVVDFSGTHADHASEKSAAHEPA